jgi:uncharacterized membrane protein
MTAARALMIKGVWIVAFILGLGWVAPTSVFAQELVTSFTSTLTLSPDSSFGVVETIAYRFSEPRHGIYRDLLTRHPDQPSRTGRERYIRYDDIAVTMANGETVPFTVENDRDRVRIKIGDPNTYVEGEQTYELRYRVVGGLSYAPSGGADLYYNVTGSGWEVPIQSVAVTIRPLPGVLRSEHACYFGLPGATASCFSEILPDGSAVFRATEVQSGEEVSVARAVDRSQVEEVVLERWQGWWWWIILGPLWLIGMIIVFYRYLTRFDTGATVVVEFAPYPNTKPMYAGLLLDGRLDQRDVTAGLVYLAQHGFLSIAQTTEKALFIFSVTDYALTLARPLSEATDRFERALLDLVFPPDAAVGTVVRLRDLSRDRVEKMANYREFTQLKSELAADLVARGFYEERLRASRAVAWFVASFAGFWVTNVWLSGVWSVLGFLVSLTMLIGAFVYRRRTALGYAARRHLLGFREYLEVAEKDRLAFHNAPERKPTQFLEFLPYAIAFGVEKEWARAFSNLTIENPEWYHGSAGSFDALTLTQSLGAFAEAYSTSSGVSASGGGGSAGGGAGGGGGGSW